MGDILSVENGHNTSLVLGNGEKGRLRHVKMRPWGIAPSSIVAGKSVVWGTEISCSDSNVASEAPLWRLRCVANYVIAPTTCLPIVEQSSA